MDQSTMHVALVSGGTGHLGRHAVADLLEHGMQVHVPHLRPGSGDRLRELVGPDPGLHLWEGVDLSEPEQVQELVSRIEASARRVPDVLLNLAGGFSMAPIEATSPNEWERLWRMNATTAFLCSRAVFAGMKERGWGRIVNVSAYPAIDRGKSGLSAYGAAKAAVLNLTQTLAKEGAAHGVTANAILPSIIDTQANRDAMPDADTSRWLPPARIAEVLRFLVSDAAGIVNGSAITLTLGPA